MAIKKFGWLKRYKHQYFCCFGLMSELKYPTVGFRLTIFGNWNLFQKLTFFIISSRNWHFFELVMFSIELFITSMTCSELKFRGTDHWPNDAYRIEVYPIRSVIGVDPGFLVGAPAYHGGNNPIILRSITVKLTESCQWSRRSYM